VTWYLCRTIFIFINCYKCFDAVFKWQQGHPACTITEWYGAAKVVICLERGPDLHISQLIPLQPTVSCFSKIQIGLPLWYLLTQVVQDRGSLNVCCCKVSRKTVPTRYAQRRTAPVVSALLQTFGQFGSTKSQAINHWRCTYPKLLGYPAAKWLVESGVIKTGRPCHIVPVKPNSLCAAPVTVCVSLKSR